MKMIYQIFTLSFLMVPPAFASNRFASVQCPSSSEVIARAYIERDLCPHTEKFPFLADRPNAEPGDQESAKLVEKSSVILTSADPAYVLDEVKNLGENHYQARFHYIVEESGTKRVLADTLTFVTYGGSVKNFMGCAGQIVLPQNRVRRASCPTLKSGS